ncbi:MAG TPA: peptide chain release factor N(5)-glutamine methyltransferase [Pyrinomonadaceae bacterium]|jgi:release factor glutamine methyltransferase
MSLSIAQAVLEATQVLREAGVPEAACEAGSLLAHTLECDRGFIIIHADEALSEQAIKTFREYVERRAAGEPLQYITGHQAFFNLDFEVTRNVLIPRPETELLVEIALDLRPTADEFFVCDVGTGSGCIAITILHERPSARALGIDISQPALQVAQKNATRHGVADRFRLVASDCFSSLNTTRSFSMIVSNPPYVAEAALPGLQREVREHEPRTALLAGTDGLSVIRRLLHEAPRYLVEHGYLLFEIGFDQHKAVECLIDTRLWEVLDIHKDLQGIPRTVALRKK